jgi:hypothetical protein
VDGDSTVSDGLDAWLPPLLRLEDYGGDWESYIEAVYLGFRSDFVISCPSIQGRRWAVKRHPLVNGREATFQHLVSVGADEEQRLPDLRRCERIRWPRAVIDALGTQRVVAWANERRRDRRVVIALPDFTYAVILADRGDHIMLWTAYVVDKAYRRKQMQAEWERSGGEDPLKG